MFQLLSRAYAEAHPMMTDRSENRCGGNFLKLGGVINGADWYSFPGGEASTALALGSELPGWAAGRGSAPMHRVAYVHDWWYHMGDVHCVWYVQEQ